MDRLDRLVGPPTSPRGVFTNTRPSFGYLAGELPVSYLMQRVPLAKFFSIMTLVWGGIVMFHAACSNYGGLMAVRFLLGFVEVCAAPIVIYILGSWYSKEEQTSRIAIWYCASGTGNITGGFFAFCIYQAPHHFRWQALFLFEGAFTIVVGVFMWFFLAASPTDARWLDDNEKRIALERCRSNKTGTEVWKFDISQVWEALRDPRLYLVFLFLFSTGLPSGGLSVFGPAIISAFGFTPEQSTLMSMAPGAATVAGSLLSLFVAKWTNRTFAGLFSLILSVVGVTMMFTIPEAHAAARYGGYILTMQCQYLQMIYVALVLGHADKSPRSPYLCSIRHQLHDRRCRRLDEEGCVHGGVSAWLHGWQHRRTSDVSTVRRTELLCKHHLISRLSLTHHLRL